MFYVHSLVSSRRLSCPCDTYRAALEWARWFNNGVENPMALIIVQDR